MPIYAYRCSACGHMQDVLQKLSDPILTVCPACGASSFAKQLTAAGFQLKGSGWYATDFRGGNTAASSDKDAGEGATRSADTPNEKPADVSAGQPAAKSADKSSRKADPAADKPAAKPGAPNATSSGDATQ